LPESGHNASTTCSRWRWCLGARASSFTRAAAFLRRQAFCWMVWDPTETEKPPRSLIRSGSGPPPTEPTDCLAPFEPAGGPIRSLLLVEAKPRGLLAHSLTRQVLWQRIARVRRAPRLQGYAPGHRGRRSKRRRPRRRSDRADERTRTADLLITSDPSDVAGGLQRLAKPLYLGGFLCSWLLYVAPDCVRGGVRVVSIEA
jgi:hypothetical protein